MEQEYLYVSLKKENYIKIENGCMTVKMGCRTVTDKIENFTLSYFKIYMGFDLCFLLQNFNQGFRWNYEGTVGKKGKDEIQKFKEIMNKHGVFENRSRVDILYNLNEKENAMVHKPIETPKRKCPNCGGTNFHAFVEDKVIRQGKTKMQTSVNLNPLKPFTLFNTKGKVVRNPLTIQVSRFICNDCGKIFQ